MNLWQSDSGASFPLFSNTSFEQFTGQDDIASYSEEVQLKSKPTKKTWAKSATTTKLYK